MEVRGESNSVLKWCMILGSSLTSIVRLKNIWTHHYLDQSWSITRWGSPTKPGILPRSFGPESPVQRPLWMGDIPCHQHQLNYGYPRAYVAHGHNTTRNKLVLGRYSMMRLPGIMLTTRYIVWICQMPGSHHRDISKHQFISGVCVVFHEPHMP